jgi:hypothetical protein
VEKLLYRYPEEVANFVVESMKEEAAREMIAKLREGIKSKDMCE